MVPDRQSCIENEKGFTMGDTKSSIDGEAGNVEAQTLEYATGTLRTNVLMSGRVERMMRSHGRQGHGYMAEQANNLTDRLAGKDAQIVGGDNAKNGADRMVNGQLIQTKYCRTALESVNASFGRGKNKNYRYYDENGRPMQLEVSADQYEEAVRVMQKRISEGRVPGVTNPDDAEKIVRKGRIDYQTAKNIAQAGTLDSLVFDAKQGAVISISAFGISASLAFVRAIWDGKSREEAVETALTMGIQSGGVAFTSSVLAAQVSRTGAGMALEKPLHELVKRMPSSVRKAMRDFLRQGSKSVFGEEASKDLTKLLRGNVITTAAVVIVLSAGDIHHFFTGKISASQLFKDVATLTVGTMAGVAAGAVTTIFLGPGGVAVAAEFLAGGVVSAGAATATSHILGKFIEDDAEQMVDILDRRLAVLSNAYLLSEEEVQLSIDELQIMLSHSEALLNMYASDNREAFADHLITDAIERVICHRVSVPLPTTLETLTGIVRLASRESSRHSQAVDPQLIGKKLLAHPVGKRAARKAWYVTHQTNALHMTQEHVLQQMKLAEQSHDETMHQLTKEKEDARKRFFDLL